MTIPQARIARILAEIQEEWKALQSLRIECDGLNSSESAFPRALASILHDFYSGVEKIFCKIAEDLNGGLPNSENWRRDLLHEMALEIPDLRPQVIAAATEEALLDYLRFRHVFRNKYGFLLNANRLKDLRKLYPVAHDAFGKDLAAFLNWLKELKGVPQ